MQVIIFTVVIIASDWIHIIHASGWMHSMLSSFQVIESTAFMQVYVSTIVIIARDGIHIFFMQVVGCTAIIIANDWVHSIHASDWICSIHHGKRLNPHHSCKCWILSSHHCKCLNPQQLPLQVIGSTAVIIANEAVFIATDWIHSIQVASVASASDWVYSCHHCKWLKPHTAFMQVVESTVFIIASDLIHSTYILCL